jgi:carbon monoxide dehydrogenase subunit G
MASIHREAILEISAERAWAALRDFGNAAHAFAGVLASASVDGDVRTVTFTSGLVAREQLVDIDDDRQRIAYTVLGGSFTHHNASMQIIAENAHRCRFVWVSDFLPNEVTTRVLPLVEAGCEVLKRNLER